jgi:uncharacterized protein YegL
MTNDAGRATRAVIYAMTDSAEAAEIEAALRECREYAREHALVVVAEVIAGEADLAGPTGTDQVTEALREHDAGVVIVKVHPLISHRSHVWFAMGAWLADGLLIHLVPGGPITAEDLPNWVVDPPQDQAPDPWQDLEGCPPVLSDLAGADGAPSAESWYNNDDIALGVDQAVGAFADFEPTGQVPLRDRDQPLPHDGLFIRRNNAFGTRSTLGIRDLIDQGILIEQTQIRFDDFVVADTGRIAAPPPDRSIEVSHGSTAVPGEYKAHSATTHFLEIALRAADTAPAGQATPDPLPVNLVFVVDVSGSMTGDKLDTVKAAVRELYRQLRDTDVLGIVSFDHRVRTVLPATPRAQLTEEHLADLLGGLRATGGTDINLGVQYGIDEISRHSYGRADIVNCLYLFSDGDPTSGETDWIQIRANIAARVRGDLTLSCFGFGSDARTRELDALAGLTGGHSTFVLNPEDVRLNLVEDLTRREHLAAINVQLQIDIDPEVTIWHLYGHDLITDPAARAAVIEEARVAGRRARDDYGADPLPDLIIEETGIRIFAPDLAFGETYWIVFELQVPAGAGPGSFGSATVQYVDTMTRSSRQHQLDLTPAGSIPADTVLVHGIGLWTSEVTFYALDDLYDDDRSTAKARLSNHIRILQAAHELIPAEQFRDDQVTFRKLISLADNLGRRTVWGEDLGSGPLGYAVYAMNTFGRVRSGFAQAKQIL